MNWDEKAEDYAVAHHTYEYLTPDENAYYTSGFVRGARWQRDALLSDESVERAAKELFYGDVDPDLDVTWATAHEGVRAEYLAMARNALTAAIGDDDE